MPPPASGRTSTSKPATDRSTSRAVVGPRPTGARARRPRPPRRRPVRRGGSARRRARRRLLCGCGALLRSIVPAARTDGFLREALLVGAGVAEVYAAAFPTAALLAVVAGILAFAARSRASLVVASLALAAAAAGVAGDAATRAAAVRLAAERVLVTAIPLVLWGGLAMFRRGPDLALVAPLAFAVTVALQLHPRPDFLHLVSVAPVLLPLAARLMRDAAARLGASARFAGSRRQRRSWRWRGSCPRSGRRRRSCAGTSRRSRSATWCSGWSRRRRSACGRSGRQWTRSPRAPMRPRGSRPSRAARWCRSSPDGSAPGRTTTSSRAGPPARRARRSAAQWRVSPPPVAVTCDAAGTDLAAAWRAYPELAALFAERYQPVVEAPPFVVYEARR